jgi:hypothetical protein
MQLINANATNRLFFTATENMVSGDWCYLNIHHVSTNTDYFYGFEKVDNLSAFTNRIDSWDVAIGDIPSGQCLYTLYEGNEGAESKTSEEILRVLEVGLYEVLTSEVADIIFSANDVTYIEPNL